jgi:hypothetical protein
MVTDGCEYARYASKTTKNLYAMAALMDLEGESADDVDDDGTGRSVNPPSVLLRVKLFSPCTCHIFRNRIMCC